MLLPNRHISSTHHTVSKTSIFCFSDLTYLFEKCVTHRSKLQLKIYLLSNIRADWLTINNKYFWYTDEKTIWDLVLFFFILLCWRFLNRLIQFLKKYWSASISLTRRGWFLLLLLLQHLLKIKWKNTLIKLGPLLKMVCIIG